MLRCVLFCILLFMVQGLHGKDEKDLFQTIKKANKKSCKDKHKSCAGWAAIGQCTENVAYMKRNCCASCKEKSDLYREDEKDLFQIIEEANKKMNSRDGNIMFSENGEAIPTLIEGDIVETVAVRHFIDTAGQDIVFDAVVHEKNKWPNAVVPYYFGRGVTSSIRKAIRAARDDYAKLTCIRWKEMRSEAAARKKYKNYVEVFKGMGCYSNIGRTGKGKQRLSLGNGCERKGIAIHEMMHALGFWHEQSRMDRDCCVTINFQNIASGFESNFKKYRKGQAQTLGEPYDPKSVMHYGAYAFSKNRRPTIVAKRGSSKSIGQRNGLSRIDIRQLKKLYCGKTSTKKTSGTCVNKNKDCAGWAKRGECEKNKAYMLSSCCASCCKDKHKSCAGWAALAQCTKNAAYMKPNCCASCMKAKSGVCTDRNKHCATWKKQKYCTSRKYKDSMKSECRKSCGHC